LGNLEGLMRSLTGLAAVFVILALAGCAQGIEALPGFGEPFDLLAMHDAQIAP
jgi:hypothetical protein